MSNYIIFPEISSSLSLKDQAVNDSFTEGILVPGWDILSRKSKLWRPILGMCLGQAFNDDFIVNEDIKLKLLFIVEILHNASLIIDDIEDKSEMRRNKKCVHLIYGEDISINAGVAMFFIPLYNLMNAIKMENCVNSEKKIEMEKLSEKSNKFFYLADF